jgi:peptidylprolyl isomerase
MVKMHKIHCFFLFIVAHAFSLLSEEESLETGRNLHQDAEKFSKHEGYEIAEELKNQFEWIDLPSVVEGIQDYIAGRDPQSVNEPEGKSTFWNIQARLFDQESKANLQKSNTFLQTLVNNKQMHSLECNKVLYEVLAEGRGTQCVQKDSTPFLHYVICTLDDQEVANTRKRDTPYKVPLLETIPGFAKGIEGMRLGERRKIFIHPDFGYGKVAYVPPNSLLIVDVEVMGL